MTPIRRKAFHLPFLAILGLLLLQSCASKKQVYYLQDSDAYAETGINFESPTFQPSDILRITVSSDVPELAVPYNKTPSAQAPNAGGLDVMKLDGYLVSPEFTINFPVLGSIPVKGMTSADLEKDLIDRLVNGKHLNDPKVNVRLINAKVSVLGEVRNPGTFSFTEEQVTVMQALGYAGDLTVNGRRDEILLIREVDGDRQITHLDLTSTEVFDSEHYYLKPNDVLVVKPNYSKVKSAGFIGNTGTIVAIASLIVSITVLLTN